MGRNVPWIVWLQFLTERSLNAVPNLRIAALIQPVKLVVLSSPVHDEIWPGLLATARTEE